MGRWERRVWAHLVGLAGEEHGAVAYTEGAFLLLAFLVDLGDGPCFYGTCLCFGLAPVDEFLWICVRWFWWLKP